MLLVIVNLSLFFDPVSKLNKICLLSAQFWIGIIILARMLFQVNVFTCEFCHENIFELASAILYIWLLLQ